MTRKGTCPCDGLSKSLGLCKLFELFLFHFYFSENVKLVSRVGRTERRWNEPVSSCLRELVEFRRRAR